MVVKLYLNMVSGFSEHVTRITVVIYNRFLWIFGMRAISCVYTPLHYGLRSYYILLGHRVVLVCSDVRVIACHQF